MNKNLYITIYRRNISKEIKKERKKLENTVKKLRLHWKQKYNYKYENNNKNERASKCSYSIYKILNSNNYNEKKNGKKHTMVQIYFIFFENGTIVQI